MKIVVFIDTVPERDYEGYRFEGEGESLSQALADLAEHTPDAEPQLLARIREAIKRLHETEVL